jgi:membrane associated rhomboid family serine protease
MIPIRNAVPSRYPPVITWILIAINCLVFLFQDSLSPDELELFLRQLALIPARYSEAFASGETDLDATDILPFFSMMFLHGGWLHLILNMWTLWLFGPTIEDRLGHGRYLAFYLACGFAASITHVIFNPTSIIPALGASGAIAGLLGCYMRLFPMARVVVVVPILFIPLFFEVYAFVYRPLVSDSGFAVDDGPPAAICQRRRRVVGPCRRVYRRVRTWPFPGPVRAALPRVLPGRRRVRLRYQGANMRCRAIGGLHVVR